MNTDVNIQFVSHVNMRVICENEGIAQDLKDHFTFFAEGYKYHPKFKARIWDGRISLYNRQTKMIPAGLLSQVVKFCKQHNFSITVPPEMLERDYITLEDIKQYVTDYVTLPKGYEVYDYQWAAVLESLNAGRKTIVSPTGSGKSLIQYLVLRYLLHTYPDDSALLVVPTVTLVMQMYSDFGEYSENDDNFNVEEMCHTLYSGQLKDTDKNILISTWQSLINLKKPYFAKFDIALVDECHQAKAVSLNKIMGNCVNAFFRYGFTGSLDGKSVNEWTIRGNFGSVFKTTTSKKLMDEGKLTPLLIKCTSLIYPEEYKKILCNSKYQDEIQWLIDHKPRTKFIAGLAKKLKGNTLILFNKRDHGENLYNTIRKITNKNVYLIHGNIPAVEREVIRKQVENEDDCVIVASYGTTSTGVNIKKIHNIVFAHPTKSLIRTIQSIGRGLRLHKSKSKVVLYDIIDDLSWKKSKNYGLKHFVERFKIYGKEGFDYQMHRVPLK